MMVDVFGRYTMNSNSLDLDRCKFVVTHASFYHQGVELFNMLPDEERLLPSSSCKNVIKIKVVLANGCLFRVDDFREYVVSIESGHLRFFLILTLSCM